MSTGRAVITGMGVAAPTGVGVEEHWDAVLAGRSGIGPISLFDPAPYATSLAGEVRDFQPSDHLASRIAVQTDRWTWLGFAAAAQAVAAATLDVAALDPYDVAVVLASSSGGNLFGQKELQRLWGGSDRTVGAYQSIAWFYAASVGQLSIHYGARGPSMVLAAESAGGLDGLAHAARLVRRGTSTVIAGGTECPLSPYALACQQRSGWLSSSADAATGYAPFDAGAQGFLPGEGGGVMVVEELSAAQRRAPESIHAEIAGWASTHDGEPTRRGGAGSVRQYVRAVRLALARAGLEPRDVDVVFPDALAVGAYDAAEASALREVFAPGEPPPVTTQKPWTGRLYQGGAVLDAVTAVTAMREGTLPPAALPATVAPGCELPFVDAARDADVRVALVVSRGFDGFNSALVLRRHDGNHRGGPRGD